MKLTLISILAKEDYNADDGTYYPVAKLSNGETLNMQGVVALSRYGDAIKAGEAYVKDYLGV